MWLLDLPWCGCVTKEWFGCVTEEWFRRKDKGHTKVCVNDGTTKKKWRLYQKGKCNMIFITRKKLLILSKDNIPNIIYFIIITKRLCELNIKYKLCVFMYTKVYITHTIKVMKNRIMCCMTKWSLKGKTRLNKGHGSH